MSGGLVKAVVNWLQRFFKSRNQNFSRKENTMANGNERDDKRVELPDFKPKKPIYHEWDDLGNIGKHGMGHPICSTKCEVEGHTLRVRTRKAASDTHCYDAKPHKTNLPSRLAGHMVSNINRVRDLTWVDTVMDTNKVIQHGKGRRKKDCECIEGWHNRWVLSYESKHGGANPADYPHGWLGRKLVKDGAEYLEPDIVWEEQTEENYIEPFTMDGEELFDFTYNYLRKISKAENWDLEAKEYDGVEVYDDIASVAMLKFLERQSKTGSRMLDKEGNQRLSKEGKPLYYKHIKNPFRYATSCVKSAIAMYRKERAETRLAVVPEDVFDDGTMLMLEHPNQLMDYYTMSKEMPTQSKITTDTLRELIDRMGLNIHPSHIRSAIDGILGNPIRYEKAESTKRNIRRLRQAIREASSDKTEGLQDILSNIDIVVDLPTATQANK
tara:strand:- start:2366 stop:3685 length:1320 start_codon:yes stop_codon:yes gene_type:complete